MKVEWLDPEWGARGVATVSIYRTDFSELEMTRGAARLFFGLQKLETTASGRPSFSRQAKMAREWRRALEVSINRQARDLWERGEMPDRVRLDDNLEPVIECSP